MYKILLLLLLLGCVYGCMNMSPFRAKGSTSLKVIVFDFGRVVGETNQERLALLVQEELHLSSQDAHELVGSYKQRKNSQKEFWDEYAQKSGKTLPLDWPEQYNELKRSVIETNQEVIKIVQTLRKNGYRTALLSNTTPERAARIRQLGFYNYFDPVLLSCETGVRKPEKGAYLRLLQQTGVSESECVFIDDNQENIDVASLLGFDCILFTSAAELRSELEKRQLL